MSMTSKKTMMYVHPIVLGTSRLLVEPDSVAQQRVTFFASNVVYSRKLACLSCPSETSSSDIDARSRGNEIIFMDYKISK